MLLKSKVKWNTTNYINEQTDILYINIDTFYMQYHLIENVDKNFILSPENK